MPSSPPPVPKPRSRYQRDSQRSNPSTDREVADGNLQPGNGTPPPPGSHHAFPTLAGVTDIITTNIPSLAGVAAAIGGSTPVPPSAPAAPSVPPSIDIMANSIAAYIPSLADAASVVANPAAATLNPASSGPSQPAANTGTASLDRIVSSLANIPSLAGIVNGVADPTVNFTTSTLTPSADTRQAPSLQSIGAAGNPHTDIGALSQLVMSTLDPTAGVTLPPAEGPVQPADKEESPYITVLACWGAEEAEEADSESSNEEEDMGVCPTPSGPDRDPASDLILNTNSVPTSPTGRIIPVRPPPPPPSKSKKPGRNVNQKIPRAATIRVSRKKGSSGTSTQQSAVTRSSWLDVWKGFRHNVLWATLDGQLVSLWKKRTDHFSELLFHVSSITNVKKHDKRRFSVYFKKKHYDFMAHNDEVHDGWVSSLLACRGMPSPTPPEVHGQITIKDPRSRVYAAIWGHNLWIYPNKEGFQLGIASFSVPLNVASVKSTGKHSFTLITPYKSFNMSVDSSKELSIWLDSLSSSIHSALSCSQVALRLMENPYNKVCGDCGAANPEWASVNLLLVICQACAGQHRALGSSRSKIRSLMMDNKVWTEPLIQLFVTYGNWVANQVWASAVPAAEQLHPEASNEERSMFIQDKYSRGRYRRVHPLTSSLSVMDQRLRQVVCTDNIEETMSLICSGAKVHHSDPQNISPILLAERAGQALQSELLRLNEHTVVPPHKPQPISRRADFSPSGEEEEELHGKLEEDRFLFSVENNSAACDVLDLREVLSVFVHQGPVHQFEIVTLNDQLICAADDEESLLTHLVHILKVILPRGVSYAEVGGASAVSKVCVVEVGGASSPNSDAWLLLWDDGVSVYPVHQQSQQTLKLELSALSHHEMNPSENIITMAIGDRSLSLCFEEHHSCESWFKHLQRALSNQSSAPYRPFPPANQSTARQSLYPVMDMGSRGSVPPGIERCISHITSHGLKVEGVYRRCGLSAKVNRLVEALMTSPSSAPLESDEQGVLDAASALKQYIRQRQTLIPDTQPWVQAAAISDERSRFKAYRQLLHHLPDDNRATLTAVIGHFYMVQVFSQVNKMSAHNLAIVLVPSLFQALNQDLIRLIREFIIHHTLLFLTPEKEEKVTEEEQITVL